MSRRCNSGRFSGVAALAAACLIGAYAGGAIAQQRPVPVMYGHDPGLDACGGLGLVKGLKSRGDNFLSVRAGPNSGQRELDRLRNGRRVWMCDERGDWIGIVYGTGEQECKVGSPIARKMPYPGPCRSGWVHKNFVELLAG